MKRPTRSGADAKSAQAVAEGLRVVTNDGLMRDYPVADPVVKHHLAG